MEPAVETLKAARKVIVRIVQAREDGGKFVPIVLALERYIAAREDLSDDLSRILNEMA
ncbi:MAG: hypothetical protein ACSHWZ_11340 [Sulfitobacter sp.]|tara:strand:+ start:1758 stop:1931 length:174 start_codon:yes stop_codon:yes gene_type:complete